MSDWLIWCLVVIMFTLIITLGGFLLYSGLMSNIIIRTGSPPIMNITVAYKFKQGPYNRCGHLYTESCRIGPELSSIGLFYDNPRKVQGEKCRCAVGSILSEGDAKPAEALLHLYEKFGFQIFSFPEVTHVVSTSFPHRTPLSIFFGVMRVYPKLDSYIKERNLCAHPFLEIYKDNLIHYMSPLGRQGDFYVPEVRHDPDRRLLGADDYEEDGGTDISGADSNSECSSGSGVLMSVSRETSLVRHRSGRGGDNDSCDRSSSASSFEELDMELPGGQGDEAETEQVEDAWINKHLKRGVVVLEEE
ncbi:hypothetical protein DPEC_G00199180 [Dallia pectoralis]|uniref:Uncharacterized protein n=1 Tax=Dallia pectoralis TaxID=75939 RepID=A0ACC2G8C2_DALPE|nr:hypothetical protein DPEC_G00199180 [Dallia pectoralis]